MPYKKPNHWGGASDITSAVTPHKNIYSYSGLVLCRKKDNKFGCHVHIRRR